MTPDQIEQVRPRLVGFAGQMLEGLPRSDQRAKGELYLRGLLLDGQRKSMRPMAERLSVDHQGLQQFITSSTWDYEVVRGNLARWGSEVIDPMVYVVDDSGFPKDGTASPCVARQYSGTLGKTGNCQIGVSVQMATDHASLAANWRLFCPASWDDTTIGDADTAAQVRRRRERAGIPDQVRHREKWRLALDMFDQMTDQWSLGKLPVVGDCGYGDATEFRLGLDERGFGYLLEVDPTASAYPGEPSLSRRRMAGGAARQYPATPASRPTCVSWPSRLGAARCTRSPGAAAPRRAKATRTRRCAPGSWRCGCARPTTTFPVTPTAACPRAG